MTFQLSSDGSVRRYQLQAGLPELRIFLNLAQKPTVQEAYDAVEFRPEFYGEVARLHIRYIQLNGNLPRDELKGLHGCFLFAAGHLLQRRTNAIRKTSGHRG